MFIGQSLFRNLRQHGSCRQHTIATATQINMRTYSKASKIQTLCPRIRYNKSREDRKRLKLVTELFLPKWSVLPNHSKRLHLLMAVCPLRCSKSKQQLMSRTLCDTISYQVCTMARHWTDGYANPLCRWLNDLFKYCVDTLSSHMTRQNTHQKCLRYHDYICSVTCNALNVRYNNY